MLTKRPSAELTHNAQYTREDFDKNLLSDRGREKGINELGQITQRSDCTLQANAMPEKAGESEQRSPKCTFIHYCVQRHKWGTLEKRHNSNVKVKGNGQNILAQRGISPNRIFSIYSCNNVQFNICRVRNCSPWFNFLIYGFSSTEKPRAWVGQLLWAQVLKEHQINKLQRLKNWKRLQQEVNERHFLLWGNAVITKCIHYIIYAPAETISLKALRAFYEKKNNKIIYWECAILIMTNYCKSVHLT